MNIGFLGFNLFLEVLSHCRWSCPGCHVNKQNDDRAFLEVDAHRLLELSQEYGRHGHPLQRLFVGPTDFLTARNWDSLVEARPFQELASLYSTLVVYSTLLCDRTTLDRKLTRLRGIHSSIKIIVPIMPSDILGKPGYLHQLRGVLDHVRSSFGIDDFQMAFNVLPAKDESFLEISRQFMREFGVKPEYNLSFARSANLETDRDEIYRQLQYVYRQLDFHIDRDGELDQSVEDWFVRCAVYREGGLYSMPLLLDPFVSFHPSFRIPDDWTFQSLQEFELKRVLRAYEAVEKMDECGGCPYLGLCSHLGVLDLMSEMRETRCIAPRAHFQDANELCQFRLFPWDLAAPAASEPRRSQ